MWYTDRTLKTADFDQKHKNSHDNYRTTFDIKQNLAHFVV